MKKIIFFTLVVLFTSVNIYATDSTTVTNTFTLDLATILGMIIACYEALSRLIPTNKTWSILGKVLEVLLWVSNLFDRKKK